MASSTRDINIRLLLTIGIVSVILLVAITLLIKAWFAWETSRAEEVKLEATIDSGLYRLQVSQSEAWVTEEQVVTPDKQPSRRMVPIKQAMEMVIDNANSGEANDPAPSAPAASAPAGTQPD